MHWAVEGKYCLLFRGSKDGQELRRAPHLQNLCAEVCQCVHAHRLSGLLQGQVIPGLLTALFFVNFCVEQLSATLLTKTTAVCQRLSSQVWCVNMWWSCLFHRLVGRPGSYLYVVGSYRMEEVINTEHTLILCLFFGSCWRHWLYYTL